MPGFVVHLGATLRCAHAGAAQPTAPNSRVLVSGQPVVTIASPYVIAGCALPPPPAANGPCLTAQFVSSATRVLVVGQPVLLLDSQSLCAPTLTPLVIGTTQTKVFAT